jgi:hypothetical protein
MQRLPFTLAQAITCSPSPNSCNFSFDSRVYPPPSPAPTYLPWLNVCEAVLSMGLTRHTSHLTPHTSHLTPHTSHLTPHTSHLTPHTSHPTPQGYNPAARRIPRNATDIYVLGPTACAVIAASIPAQFFSTHQSLHYDFFSSCRFLCISFSFSLFFDFVFDTTFLQFFSCSHSHFNQVRSRMGSRRCDACDG